jgi:hypothetical protein
MLRRVFDHPPYVHRGSVVNNRGYLCCGTRLYWVQLPHGELQLIDRVMPNGFNMFVFDEFIVIGDDRRLETEMSIIDYSGRTIMTRTEPAICNLSANARGFWWTDEDLLHLQEYAGTTLSFPMPPQRWSYNTHITVDAGGTVVVHVLVDMFTGDKDRYKLHGDELVPFVGPIAEYIGMFNMGLQEFHLDRWKGQDGHIVIYGNSYRRRVELMLRLQRRLPPDLQRMVVGCL